jgi:hypothetical protein
MAGGPQNGCKGVIHRAIRPQPSDFVDRTASFPHAQQYAAILLRRYRPIALPLYGRRQETQVHHGIRCLRVTRR